MGHARLKRRSTTTHSLRDAQAAQLNLRQTVAILCLCAIIAACGGSEPSQQAAQHASAHVRAQLETGSVIGFEAPNGARVWRGIPYATAPVGDLRWRAPRPAASWTGDRVSVDQPAWCPQITTSLDELYGIKAGQVRGSEDCLFTTIYAPADTEAGQTVPVMVWIHGGSNVWGRAEEYDASVLAEQHGVVVVVVQYRLGPLGFFTHPALRDDAKDTLDTAANFAVLDLIEALRWVQTNAAAFGGDADNVTIFGESAGALNVYALIVSPLSRGLFRRAIVESGNPRSMPLEWAEKGREGVSNPFSAVAVEMTGEQNPTAEDLRSLSISQIFAPYFGETGREDTPTMLNDGVSIPADGIYPNLANSLQQRGIPIIFGSNRDEAKYLLAFDPRFTKKRFGLFPAAKDKDYYDAVSEYLSGTWRAITVNGPANTLAAAGVENVYTYRFDWDEQGKYWLSDMSYLIGASHMVEIPFVFGSFDTFLGKLGTMMFNKDNRPERTALSNEMMSYWSNFAYEGEPGQGLSGHSWPSLLPGNASQTLVFDTQAGGGIRVADDVASVADIVSAVREDPRLDAMERRCTVATALDQIFGLIDERLGQLRTDSCGS